MLGGGEYLGEVSGRYFVCTQGKYEEDFVVLRTICFVVVVDFWLFQIRCTLFQKSRIGILFVDIIVRLRKYFLCVFQSTSI